MCLCHRFRSFKGTFLVLALCSLRCRLSQVSLLGTIMCGLYLWWLFFLGNSQPSIIMGSVLASKCRKPMFFLCFLQNSSYKPSFELVVILPFADLQFFEPFGYHSISLSRFLEFALLGLSLYGCNYVYSQDFQGIYWESQGVNLSFVLHHSGFHDYLCLKPLFHRFLDDVYIMSTPVYSKFHVSLNLVIWS